MKHIRKISSALILFAEMSALYILIPYLFDAGLRAAFFYTGAHIGCHFCLHHRRVCLSFH